MLTLGTAYMVLHVIALAGTLLYMSSPSGCGNKRGDGMNCCEGLTARTVVQELQGAASRTAEEHQRLLAEASDARERLRSLLAATGADADKIAALQATLLYQEHKYKVCPALPRYHYVFAPLSAALSHRSETNVATHGRIRH